jgi:hypothetical protein
MGKVVEESLLRVDLLLVLQKMICPGMILGHSSLVRLRGGDCFVLNDIEKTIMICHELRKAYMRRNLFVVG